MGKEFKVTIVLSLNGNLDKAKRALDGIYGQEVDFNVEILATDRFARGQNLKQELEGHFNENAPDSFELIVRSTEQETPSPREAWFLLNESEPLIANGDYIAYMDSDDIWTDSQKLKKQATFLENNKNFCAITHAVQIDPSLTDNPDDYSDISVSMEKIFNIFDIIKDAEGDLYCHNLGYLYRNKRKGDFFLDEKLRDKKFLTHISLTNWYLSDGEPVYNLDDHHMAIYEAPKGGFWLNDNHPKWHSVQLLQLTALDDLTDFKYSDEIRTTIATRYKKFFGDNKADLFAYSGVMKERGYDLTLT